MSDILTLLDRVSPRLLTERRELPAREDKYPRNFEIDAGPVVYPGKVECPRCHDAGWLQTGEFEHGRTVMVRCGCRAESDANRLAQIDGVLDHEREIAFSDFVLTKSLQPVMPTLLEAVRRRAGFITMYGADTGTGKSALLKAAVNAGRKRNLQAAYRRLSKLLQELRNQYGNEDDGDFQARWDILIDADILAVDEIEKWNPTAWAVERFDELIDDRYRRLDTHLTLLAGNSIDHLEQHNRSRLHDLNARLYYIEGVDVRREER